MMPLLWILPVMLLAFGGQAREGHAHGAQTSAAEPTEIGQLRRELSTGCRSRSGQEASFGPEFLRRVNLSPDGVPDFVVDVSGMTCPGAAGAFCRGGECPVHVFVSVPGGHRKVLERFAHGVEVRPGPDRDVLVFGDEAMAWDGNRFGRVSMPPPPPPQGSGPASPGGMGAWTLLTAPRLVAASPTLGLIRGFQLYCDGPLNPVVEVTFTSPMPARLDMALTVGGMRVPATFLRHSPTEAIWRADVFGAPEIGRLLAIATGAVEVTLNGMPMGALGMTGADAAVRQAFGRCLRLPSR